MPYAPTVNDNSGEILGRAISGAFGDIGDAMKAHKEEQKQIKTNADIGKFLYKKNPGLFPEGFDLQGTSDKELSNYVKGIAENAKIGQAVAYQQQVALQQQAQQREFQRQDEFGKYPIKWNEETGLGSDIKSNPYVRGIYNDAVLVTDIPQYIHNMIAAGADKKSMQQWYQTVGGKRAQAQAQEQVQVDQAQAAPQITPEQKEELMKQFSTYQYPQELSGVGKDITDSIQGASDYLWNMQKDNPAPVLGQVLDVTRRGATNLVDMFAGGERYTNIDKKTQNAINKNLDKKMSNAQKAKMLDDLLSSGKLRIGKTQKEQSGAIQNQNTQQPTSGTSKDDVYL